LLPTARIDTQYEIVVLGGGIAGLLIASELARDHSVLVVEEKGQIPKTKYWLTDAGSAQKNPDLHHAIDSTYESLDFIAYDTTTFRCRGSYPLWNTDRLVEGLTRTIHERGGVILTGHRFYGFKKEPSALLVFTNDRSYRVRLAVDCMGFGSPTIYAKGIVDIIGYYLLYGASYPSTGACDPVGLHNLMLSSQPAYVEAFPAAEDLLHLILILPTKTVGKPASLREDFSFLVNRSPYSRILRQPASPEGFLGGVIPVGRIRKPALDRMFFFGEAGQFNPAASATALTRMLYTYRETGARLRERLAADRLSASDLSSARVAPASPLNERLQRVLFRDILDWSSDYFAEVLAELQHTGDSELIYDLMFGTVELGRTLKPSRIVNLVAKRSRFLAKTFLRGLLPGSA